MERCPRCASFVDTSRAYCQVCSRPRILESLRAPRPRPGWQDQVWRGVILVLALWLVVTLGVAFFREAKAVRDARLLLAEGHPDAAWIRLEPFLKSQPRHRQALFLCGQATVQLKQRTAARDCLERLGGRSSRLAQELREDYVQALRKETVELTCDAEKFEELHTWAKGLGGDAPGVVIGGLDRMVGACIEAQDPGELATLAASLAEQGQPLALIEHGFVPLIERAVAADRADESRSLAWLARNLVPDAASAVAAALKSAPR